ncbi:hypothetical protein ISS07_01095 [Candidatus Woesearchaeota archaeon]|nr:hypothetical protein [Candidatus Woesearchaeota archaeon]
MNYVFEMYKEFPELAKEEVLALTNNKNPPTIDNLLQLTIKDKRKIKFLAERLAYTKSINKLLFEVNYKDFLKKIESYNWKKIYKKNFGIESINLQNKKLTKEYSEKKLAGYVWRAVKEPKVKLKNPETDIRIFFTKNKVFCCLLLENIEQNFEKRKSHLRPKPSPISLHPKLARSMINLTGIKKGTVLDPFCGSGGILIEAGLMELKTIGTDINQKMIWKSMVNLKHFRVKSKLEVKDFFDTKKKYEYIVADLPYGLNASIMKNIRVTKKNKEEMKKYLENFYSDIALHLKKILTKKAVIIFPNYVNYKKLIKKSKLKIKKEFSVYVHSNLTRKILVITSS